MSKLSSLVGKSQTFTIGGVELELKPLNMENLDLIANLEDESKRVVAMKKIIAITLKQAVPDATDEEIAHIGLTYLQDVSDAIVKVNGLKDVSRKD